MIELPKQSSKIFNEEGIAKIEEHYGATFVGDFCLKSKDGDWINIPVPIFYQHNSKFDNDYFALYYLDGKLYVSDGTSAFDAPIYGKIADDGEVIYSPCRWGYTTSRDGSVMVDGGRDYFRCSENGKSVRIHPIKDKLFYEQLDN